MKRIRQVVWRRAVQSDAVLLPVVVREERFDRKLSVSDFPIDPEDRAPDPPVGSSTARGGTMRRP